MFLCFFMCYVYDILTHLGLVTNICVSEHDHIDPGHGVFPNGTKP